MKIMIKAGGGIEPVIFDLQFFPSVEDIIKSRKRIDYEVEGNISASLNDKLNHLRVHDNELIKNFKIVKDTEKDIERELNLGSNLEGSLTDLGRGGAAGVLGGDLGDFIDYNEVYDDK